MLCSLKTKANLPLRYASQNIDDAFSCGYINESKSRNAMLEKNDGRK